MKKVGIKVLSKACGVLPHSIRTWETRYQLFKPTRSEGGQREYSLDDVAKGKLIGMLLNEGHAISKLAGLSIKDLEELVKQDPSPKDRDNLETNKSIDNLMRSLARYNIDDVVAEFQHLRAITSAKEFIFKAVLPVMQDIGLKVAKGTYSVTQEHIVSTIVRDQIARLDLPNIGEKERRVALATPDGNLHELSILIADVICRSNRVPTSYLGASHPAQCLGEAVNALKIETIILGVVSSDDWDYEKSMVSYLESLDKFLNVKVKVVLGGGWEMDFPSFTNIEEVEVIKTFEIFDKLLTE